MGQADAMIRRLKARMREQSFQEKIFVAFKLGCSVSVGTLLSLTPGYAALWNNPLSLGDQVIFTILGGANMTVGGVIAQLPWLFFLSAITGSTTYMVLGILGGSPVAQGIVFFFIVYAISAVRFLVPASNGGLQFTTLAAVYAIDGAFRSGNQYAVDWLALEDLMKSWAFGAAISLMVNFIVLPVKASRLSSDRSKKALAKVRDITSWLLQADPATAANHTPASVRTVLHGDMGNLAELYEATKWEFSWSASNLAQRKEIMDGVSALMESLISSCRDGRFVVDLPEDLASIVRPAVSAFTDWCLPTLDGTMYMLEHHKPVGERDNETAWSTKVTLQGVMEARSVAARVIIEEVIQTFKAEEVDVVRLELLDRAHHCLDAAHGLAVATDHLHQLVLAESQRPRRIQSYLTHTLSSGISHLFTRSQAHTAASRRDSAASFVPAVPLSHRILAPLTSPASQYAFKVTTALCCLLAMLWSPLSRDFFLAYVVRNSTVPLLLALNPTVGLSVISWLGQLLGAAIGCLWAAMIMLIWRGVGPKAFSVPGLFFFEWILCLLVGHRMVHGPDYFAVTSMNACAIFINTQWYLQGTPGAVVLPMRLAFMLTTATIAIAFAIPFQLGVFPRHARDELRKATAGVLSRLAQLALDEVKLSDLVLFTQDEERIKVETERLTREVQDIQGNLRGQDGLVELAAAERGSMVIFHADRAREMVEALHRCVDVMADHIGMCKPGAVDPRIRTMLSPNDAKVARAFAEACSHAFWSLGVSWLLFEYPPAPLPSVHAAGHQLLLELQHPAREDSRLNHLRGDPLIKADLSRLWCLTLTLVTQRTKIERLMTIMGPDWERERARSSAQRPALGWSWTGLSSTKSATGVSEGGPVSKQE